MNPGLYYIFIAGFDMKHAGHFSLLGGSLRLMFDPVLVNFQSVEDQGHTCFLSFLSFPKSSTCMTLWREKAVQGSTCQSSNSQPNSRAHPCGLYGLELIT